MEAEDALVSDSVPCTGAAVSERLRDVAIDVNEGNSGNGLVNTGGGGGGLDGNFGPNVSGNGGSGIVIIRYLTQ